jgi:hypothetical protein
MKLNSPTAAVKRFFGGLTVLNKVRRHRLRRNYRRGKDFSEIYSKHPKMG